MILNKKQSDNKFLIDLYAPSLGIDVSWALAIAMTESSLGIDQKSSTGCRGVFQMSLIAMKDLLQEMEKNNDDLVDILCGLLFLRLLLKRWKTIEDATLHYCDPKDRHFYLDRVKHYMKEFKEDL